MKKLFFLIVAFICAMLCMNVNSAVAQQDSKVNCQDKAMVFKNSKNAADSTKLSLPEYQGGVSALRKYVRENLEYPQVLESVQAEGTTMVQFIVGADGEVSEVTVVESSGFPEMDDEAERVVQSFPNWNPANKNGKAISMRTQVPIHCLLYKNM